MSACLLLQQQQVLTSHPNRVTSLFLLSPMLIVPAAAPLLLGNSFDKRAEKKEQIRRSVTVTNTRVPVKNEELRMSSEQSMQLFIDTSINRTLSQRRKGIQN